MFYNLIVDHPDVQFTPRTYLFGAKASPGYYRAKLIIKLINSIGELVKKHPRASQADQRGVPGELLRVAGGAADAGHGGL